MSRSSACRFFLLNVVIAALTVGAWTIGTHNDQKLWRQASLVNKEELIELLGMVTLGLSVVLYPAVRKDEPEFPRALPPERPTRAPAYARVRR